MCGLPGNVSNTPKDWLGGVYQVYPLAKNTYGYPDASFLENFEAIKAVFPNGLEAYCVFAFLIAADDAHAWAGATYMYLDRLTIALGRIHRRTAWKRLFRWIVSLGKSKELRSSDVIDLICYSFVHMFWVAMKGLIAKGYVRVEVREFDDEEDGYGLEGDTTTDALFPTPLLIANLVSRRTE